MIVFEIKEHPSIFYRVWREIYTLLLFNIGVIIGGLNIYKKHYLIIEFCFLLLLAYKLFNKKGRQIYKIVFSEHKLVITYYQFIFLSFIRIIPYDNLQFNFKDKLYIRGEVTKTLEFKENNDFIGEIKYRHNLGWTDNEINNIYEALVKAKEDESNF
jgi:hypothetical protein